MTGALMMSGGIVAVALIGAALFAARLAHGPMALDMLKAPLAAALEERIGHGYRFDIGETALDKGEFGPALTLNDVKIRDSAGRVVVAAPKAQVELDLVSLMLGTVKPTRFELVDLDVRVAVLPSGEIAMSAGNGRAEPIPLVLGAAALAPPASATAAAPIQTAAIVPGRAADAAAPAPATPMHSLAMALAATIDGATSADSPIAALVRLGIARGRLVVDDQAADQTTTFKGLELAFDKDTGGAANLSIAANGPNGRWSGTARAAGGAGKDRVLDVDLHDLSLAEVMLAAGIRHLPFDTDIPLSTKIHFVLDANGALKSVDGQFELGAGHFHIDDPDDVPRLIDEIVGTFHFDPASRDIKLGPIQFYAQETQLTLAGAIEPPVTADGVWTLNLGGTGTLAPQVKSDNPLTVGKAEFVIRYDQGQQRLSFDRVAVQGPEIAALLTGSASVSEAGPTMKLQIETQAPTALRALLPIWPVFIAPRVRAWILTHMPAGTLDSAKLNVDLDAAGLAASRANLPIPADGLHLDLTLRDASIDMLDGALPITGITGTGHVTGRSSSFADMQAGVDVSPGRHLSLSELGFAIVDNTIKPIPAAVTARIEGGTDALLELLTRDALKKYVSVPPEVAGLRGQVDGHATLDMKLGPNVSEAPLIRVSGQVNNFGIDRAFGNERVEGNTLTVAIDPSGVRAKGDARIWGAPGTFELRKAADGTGEATIALTFDEAARAKRGMSFGSALTGPVTARIVAPIGQKDGAKAQIDLDFARAAIDGALPGLVKPAGKPGKVSFALNQRPDGLSLDQLAIDSGSLSIRGAAELTSDGKFVSAKLSQVRLSPGDDMRVDAAIVSDALKVTVRGNVVDARPFLRNLFTAAAASPDSRDFDLDFKSQTVAGQNQEKMTAVELHLLRKGGQMRQLQLSGRFGRSPLTAALGGGDGATLTLAATDAGAALSFIDLYKHMEGGKLAATIRLADSRQDGVISIHDFVVRNEPAIRSLSAEAVPQSMKSDRSGAQAAPVRTLDPTAVPFERLQSTFTRSPGQIVLRDTVVSGSAIGATVEGTVDFGRNRVNLHGTFVPAYAFNNLFSQIPLFGPILGGGSNEGLFAVTYRVTGSANAPQLIVDPLSAIAPGFLRQIFGAFDGTGLADGAGTGATTPQQQQQQQLEFPTR